MYYVHGETILLPGRKIVEVPYDGARTEFCPVQRIRALGGMIHCLRHQFGNHITERKARAWREFIGRDEKPVKYVTALEFNWLRIALQHQ